MSTLSPDQGGPSVQNLTSNHKLHPFSIRIFHWVMALLVIGMICSGLFMVRLDDANSLKYDTLYVWHQSFGILVFGLGSMRLLNRLRLKLTPLPSSIAPVLQKLAKLTYAIFYTLMIILPISGLVMSSAYPDGGSIPFFGLEIPSLTGPSESLFDVSKTIHRLAGYVFGILILAHVLATVKHRFFDVRENDVLARML